jgi:hypothetical protein
MPGKQLKKLQLLSPVQNKPSPPSTLPKNTRAYQFRRSTPSKIKSDVHTRQ